MVPRTAMLKELHRLEELETRSSANMEMSSAVALILLTQLVMAVSVMEGGAVATTHGAVAAPREVCMAEWSVWLRRDLRAPQVSLCRDCVVSIGCSCYGSLAAPQLLDWVNPSNFQQDVLLFTRGSSVIPS